MNIYDEMVLKIFINTIAKSLKNKKVNRSL